MVEPELLRGMEDIPQDAVFTFPLEGGVTLAAHKFVLAVTSPAFKAQFYGGRFKEEQVEVVDHSRWVKGGRLKIED